MTDNNAKYISLLEIDLELKGIFMCCVCELYYDELADDIKQYACCGMLCTECAGNSRMVQGELICEGCVEL